MISPHERPFLFTGGVGGHPAGRRTGFGWKRRPRVVAPDVWWADAPAPTVTSGSVLPSGAPPCELTPPPSSWVRRKTRN